jgi:hypothetical protein
MSDHLWQNGSQSNILLQRAIAKYGLDNFSYFVIEFVADNSQLIAVEQKYLDMFPSNLRYNFCPTAGSSLGYKHTADSKAAISDAHKGITYVYDINENLIDSFPSHTAAAEFLGCTRQRVDQLVKSGGRTRKGFRVTDTLS